LLFIRNPFCGAEYPKPLRNIAAKFKNKYVTENEIKPNQPVGDVFSKGLTIGNKCAHFSEHE
jgi:hypothetical protein